MEDGLQPWIDDYDLHLRTGNVADLSRITYMRGVRQFVAHLTEHHPDIADPSLVRRSHIESWVRWMNENGKAEATRRSRIIAVNLWFKWLSGEHESGVTINPAMGIGKPTPKLKPVPIVRDEIIAALLDSASGSTFVDRRDTAIIRMLFDCGMRRGELVRLDVRDVDTKYMEATLHGKGGKVRIVPFGARTALALNRYLRARRLHKGAEDSAALFLASRRSTRPGTVDPWRLHGSGVAEMLKRRAKVADVEQINPHRFRHTFSHDLLAAGANETDVERLAGWSSPMMVRRYGSALADDRARDTHRRLARGDRV